MDTKICTKCGLLKPLSDFGKAKHHRDGLKYYCKQCVVLDNKQRRENPPVSPRHKPTLGLKYCYRCKADKPYSDFAVNNKTNDKLQDSCRKCTSEFRAAKRLENPEQSRIYDRDRLRVYVLNNPEKVHQYKVKYFYKLPANWYKEKLQEQNGGCAVCRSKDPGHKNKYFSIDHDHACCLGKRSCGKCVRGLLCYYCNIGQGYYKDSPPLLVQAAAYLCSFGKS